MKVLILKVVGLLSFGGGAKLLPFIHVFILHGLSLNFHWLVEQQGESSNLD